MTVKELIEKLETYPGDMDVVINVSEEVYGGFKHDLYLASAYTYGNDVCEAVIEILDCID